MKLDKTKAYFDIVTSRMIQHYHRLDKNSNIILDFKCVHRT